MERGISGNTFTRASKHTSSKSTARVPYGRCVRVPRINRKLARPSNIVLKRCASASAPLEYNGSRRSPACIACHGEATGPPACRRDHGHDTAHRPSVALLSAGALQFPVGETVTQTFARLLGYSVLVGSCFRSTPQIARIIRAKSARGVSLTASIAELVAYSITCAYNFRLGYAFSTYGEVAACWLQDIALVALISRHIRNSGKRLVVGTVAFAVYCWWLSSSHCSMKVLRMLQASTISIVAIGGRIPQIVLNVRRGDSGELSITTSALNLAGNMARMFTTLVLTQDGLLFIANAVQGVLNTVLLWQTAMSAYQQRQQRLLRDKEDAEDLPEDPEAMSQMGVSPASIETTDDAEASETSSESSSPAAIGDAASAAAVGGDGGYGGGGSLALDPNPGDLSEFGIGIGQGQSQE